MEWRSAVGFLPLTALTVGAALLNPSAVAAATLRPGDIVVVDLYSPPPYGPGLPAVILVDRNTGAQTLVTSGNLLQMPVGVAVGADGLIYVSDGGAGEIIKVDPNTGQQALVPHDGRLVYPLGIAIGEDGEIFVADIGYEGTLYRIQNGSQVTVASGTGTVEGVALLPRGGFLLADYYRRVLNVAADGSLSVVVSSDEHFGGVTGVAAGNDGNVYVADLQTDGESDPSLSGSVIAVDPNTGMQTILSRGGSLRYPRGIAAEASGDLLVADPWGGCVKQGNYCINPRYPGEDLIRVDHRTGAQAVVSAGQMFGEVFDVAVVPGVPNGLPVAVIAPPPTVECARGTFVTLDGSASHDPDGDSLSYKWLSGFWTGPPGPGPGDGPVLGTTPSLTVAADFVGQAGYTLVVDDGHGGTAFDSVLVNGVDTIPPTLSVQLSPSILWPPDHRLVPIEAIVTASDACKDVSTSRLSIVSSEPDDGLGDGDTGMDVQERGDAFSLRAERSGVGPGRAYTVTYEATESGRRGKTTVTTAVVVVPHSAP